MAQRIFLFLSFLGSLSAMLTGNPADPGLLEASLVRSKPGPWSLRLGYLDDCVYNQSFHEEFTLQGATKAQTAMKLSTYAALITLNIKNRCDLYGLVGSCRMQIDQEIFTKRALGWGAGGKLLLLKWGNFFIGTDVKYFETNQKPKYFVVEGFPFNIVSNYRLKYQEIQAAMGFSYRAWVFAPYLNATYILTKVQPDPPCLFVRFPDVNEIADLETSSIITQKRWGMSLGLTLFDDKKASLSFEWRAFNQNAIDVNGEIRF